MASTHLELGFEKHIHEKERQLSALESHISDTPDAREAIRTLKAQIQQELRELYDKLDPSEIVKVARHSARPQTLDYIELIFDEFVELHGDRAFGDDRAMITGFAKLEDQKVLVVGQHKGRTIKERNECYFGCAHPEGYRKSLEKMKLAAKFRLPIICLIDTPGAYPGIGAEERGQASSIAVNLRELSLLRTPMVCVVIGEGGSGGALGIGVGDHVAMLQFAYYSVISPEGCARHLMEGRPAGRPGRPGPQVHQCRSAADADCRRSDPRAAGGCPSRPPKDGGHSQALVAEGVAEAVGHPNRNAPIATLPEVPQVRRV